MNKDQIKKNVGDHVQLVPAAHRLGEHGPLAPKLEDMWVILEVNDAGVRISSLLTRHQKTLGFDHIYKFTSDGRVNGVARGFLSLHVQLMVHNEEVRLIPNARPGEPVPIESFAQSESPATRLIRLFQAHGVHRNQIPRVFGRGLKPSHVQSDTTLLPVLDDAMLDAAAELFAVRREWLEGASDQIYPLHDFYKRPEEFREFISGLRKQSTGEIRGVVLAAVSEEFEETALIVLEQQIGTIGDRPLHRYQLCGNWIFAYWKARAFLTACVALAWQAKAYLLGRKVPIETIRRYKEGTNFLEYKFDGALPTEGFMWHPEDMAVKPDAYVDGIDEGNFGIKEGLAAWLQLEAEGFMETDLPYTGVRQAFEQALKEKSSRRRRSPK
jgi:hypothetical protein